jgi:hypothetical protein
VTRVSAGDVGAAPSLPTPFPTPAFSDVRQSVPFVESEEEVDESDADAKATRDGDYDSVQERDSHSEDEEVALLLQEHARLRAKEAVLRAQRVAKLRRDIARRSASIASLEAEVDEGDVSPAGAPSAAAAAQQTPTHVHLRPRTLAFQSTVGRKPPTAAAVARRAAIEQLPDLAPTSGQVSVVIAPTPAVVGSGRVVAPTITNFMPAGLPLPGLTATSTHAEPRTTVNKPKEFTGDNVVQNEKVELWVDAMNRFLHLSRVPAYLHLDTARSYFSSTGAVSEFVAMKEDEVMSKGKQLTWDYLQSELIEQYAQRVGAAAREQEWAVLKMGVKPGADGKDDSKSTRTVKDYTNRFLYLLRCLTVHTPQTTDLTTIQKYVGGIKDGYPALYAMMLGLKPTLRFESLQDAIDEAEVAEGNLAIAKMEGRSALSTPGWSSRRFGGGNRATTESLNNLQGEYDEEDEGPGQETAAATTPKSQLNGFRSFTSPEDGRYKLTEKEQRMLYDSKRCYRCYGQHPFGMGKPTCAKPVQKVAPRPLK